MREFRTNPFWNELKEMQRFMDAFIGNTDTFAPAGCVSCKPTNDNSGHAIHNENKKNSALDIYRKPVTDIVENEANFLATFELPGANKEDVKVKINDDAIEIKVEKKQEINQEDKESGTKSFSRWHRSYYRKIALPEQASTENIKAEYKDGVLTLDIPKKMVEEKKAVEIKVD